MKCAAEERMKYKNLTDREISELIKEAMSQCNAGLRGKSYEKILKGTLFVVDRLVEKYRGLSLYEDIKQIGRQSLYNAIITFNPEKCPKFYGWAVPWIKKDVAIAALQAKEYFNQNDFENDAMELASQELDENNPEEIFLNRERNNVLWHAVGKTGVFSAYLIEDLFNNDQSEKDISVKIKMSIRKIQSTRNRALKTLADNPELRMAIA